MEILQIKMKSVGSFLKRRGSVTEINIKPELKNTNISIDRPPQHSMSRTEGTQQDPYEEVYKLKKQLQETDTELKNNQEMLKDYISNRINISRALPVDDQIFRLKQELRKLGYEEPETARPLTPPVTMEEYTKLSSELISLQHEFTQKEQQYKTRIRSIKTAHAEEIANMNLDIFELRDQLQNQPKGGSDSRLVIELSTQMSMLSAEIDELRARLQQYEAV